MEDRENMSNSYSLNRRTFNKAAVTLGFAASPSLRALGANERIGIGLIGCGGRGIDVMRRFMQNNAEIRAVCDVDKEHLARARDTADGNPKSFHDFRKLLEQKDIDAVLIGTPDHWHALVFIEACKAGKDVYCEKPLSTTIYEGRMMVNAARQYKRVSQGGTQQHSGAHYKEAIQLIHDGYIGPISKVVCWNTSNSGGRRRAEQPTDPPPELDWELWLGPAPKVPYVEDRCHGSFRYYWDYSGGRATDFGVHHMDIVHWALDQDAPRSVVCEGGKFVHPNDGRDVPDTQDILYTYNDCLVQHTLRQGNAHPGHGHFDIQFLGREGTILVNRGRYEIYPEEGKKNGVERKTYKNPAPQRDMTRLHVAEFLEKIKTRERCVCDVEVCHRATTAPILGNIAYRTGERLVWDGENEEITNHPALNSWLHREYREPWRLEI